MSEGPGDQEGLELPSEIQPTVTFVFGKSMAIIGEPDGFSSADENELPRDEVIWWNQERDRAKILSQAITHCLPDWIGTDAEQLQIDYLVSFVRGRMRPTICVTIERSQRLPDKEHLDAIASMMGLLGGREWVLWTGTDGKSGLLKA
jgi:hypothetical protein